MKKRLSAAYLIGLLLVGLAGIANANGINVIFDNGMDNIYSSYIASSPNHSADNFQLQNSYWVTDVHWRGAYNPNSPIPADNFIIRFYNDDGSGTNPTALGSPPIFEDNVGVVNRGDTGLQFTNAPDFDVYEYSTVIDPFYAVGGNVYWLEIQNHTEPNSIQWWYWSFGLNGQGVSGIDSWYFTGNDHAFQLTGDPVPEPATMLLLGTGLVGVAGAVRRKKKNQS